MDKALKVLVVLVLLLSLVAVFMELGLYKQRQELKGRAVKLSEYVGKIASTVEVPQPNADLAARDAEHMKVDSEKLKRYYKLGDDGKPSKVTTGEGTMDAELLNVFVNAGRQFDRLNDTRTGLEHARTTLGETSNTLVKTEGVLTETKGTLAKTEQELTTTKQEVEKKAGEITELNAQVETQKADLEKKSGEIATLTEKVSDADSKIEAGKRYITKLEKELKICQGQFDTNALPRGIQGQITVVSTNWNFVVMDLFPDSAMLPLTDLTVQRADKLVGKVRVTEVRRDQRIALGEILMEYQQMPPLQGDSVFY